MEIELEASIPHPEWRPATGDFMLRKRTFTVEHHSVTALDHFKDRGEWPNDLSNASLHAADCFGSVSYTHLRAHET